MFLGGVTTIPQGGSEVFTLDRDQLATIAGGLGDGYYADKGFWKEVLITFQQEDAENVVLAENATLIAGGAQNVTRVSDTSALTVGDEVRFGPAFSSSGKVIASIIDSTDFTVSPGHGVSSSDQNIDIAVIGQTPVAAGATAQRKTLSYTDLDTASMSVTSTAATGKWVLRDVTIIDYDHGKLVIEPADIPNINLYDLSITV